MVDKRSRALFAGFALLALAGCASAPQAEVGACRVTPPAEPVACTRQYDPVCGCDGKTYSNACSARASGVPDSTPGACGGARND